MSARRAVGALLALVAVIGLAVWASHRRVQVPPPPPPPAPVHVESVAPPPPPAPPPPKPHQHARTATISGILLDPSGRPVSGAKVSAAPAWTSNSHYSIADAHTGPSGGFDLENIEPGERVAITAAPGDSPPSFPPLSTTVDAPAHNVRLQLSPGLPLAGVVLDARGHELPGVDVSLQLGDKPQWFGQTDSRGAFLFEHLAAGRYHVVAKSVGALRLLVAEDAGVHPGAPAVKLHLPPVDGIAGTVVDDSGKPLPSASVRIEASRDEASSGRTEGVVRTGPDGTFTADVPSQSHVSLTVTDVPGCEDAAASAEAGDTSIRVVLRRETIVTGRVLGRERAPLRSFRINGEEYSATDGRFRLSSRTLAEGLLRIDADEYAETGVSIPRRDSRSVDLGDIVLGEGRTVVGRVYDGATGNPLDGTSVGWATDCAHHPAPRRCTETDSDGRFTLFRVPDTVHSLWAGHEGALKAHVMLTDAPMYVEVTLDRGSRIEGRVLNAAGHPAAGVRVEDWGDSGNGLATTDRAGHFAMGALIPDSYVVKTFADDGILPVRVAVGEHETAEVELRPPASGTRVLLRVVDTDGAPVAVTDAWAIPGDRAHDINNSDVVNARRLKATAIDAVLRGGELVLDRVPAGQVTAVVERGQMPFAVAGTIPAKARYELTVHVPEAFCEIDSTSDQP